MSPRSSATNRRRPAADGLANRREYPRARPVHPLTIDRGRVAERHFPGGLEATEVIDADDIDLFEQVAEASDPPLKLLVSDGVPVVERVAP